VYGKTVVRLEISVANGMKGSRALHLSDIASYRTT
jgi:hypothetical protein